MNVSMGISCEFSDKKCAKLHFTIPLILTNTEQESYLRRYKDAEFFLLDMRRN